MGTLVILISIMVYFQKSEELVYTIEILVGKIEKRKKETESTVVILFAEEVSCEVGHNC